MEKKVNWQTDFAAALIQAVSEDKPVLLDFYNPG
jgi:uncharacterized protein YyaL (SSP411 family)